jgi:HEAT repeat protein
MGHVEALIQALEGLSPMPPDESPELTAERLRSYGDVVTQIDRIVRGSQAEQHTRFIKPLIRSFGYGDAYEGYWPVIHILERYPPDILRPALREGLRTGEAGARMWCAYMLGRHRDDEDVPLLVAALNDPEFMVRRKALKALAMVGDLAARPAIEALLGDPVDEVRKEAKGCIRALADRR